MSDKNDKPTTSQIFFMVNGAGQPAEQPQTPFLFRLADEGQAVDPDVVEAVSIWMETQIQSFSKAPLDLKFEKHPLGLLVTCQSSSTDDMRTCMEFLVDWVNSEARERFGYAVLDSIKEYETGAKVGECGGDCNKCASGDVPPDQPPCP